MGWSNAELVVDDVLSGRSAGSTITIEQLTTSAGEPIVLDGVEPLEVGDRGFFFLRPGEGDTYVLVSSQGRYLEQAGRLRGRARARADSDAVVSRTEQLSSDEMRAAVARAREAVAQGRLRPQRPAYGPS